MDLILSSFVFHTRTEVLTCIALDGFNTVKRVNITLLVTAYLIMPVLLFFFHAI